MAMPDNHESAAVESVDTPIATPEPLGLLAEFSTPEALIAAASRATDAGYKKVDAFSPFPLHGIDEALKTRKTILPWVVLCAGLSGIFVALGLQYFTNAVETSMPFSGYAFRISGKPYFSLPANIPVTFEVIILLSAFAAFFGMLMLNGLPKLSNPLFRNARFRRATDDAFLLFIEASDKNYDEAQVESMLNSAGATSVELCEQDADGFAMPTLIYAAGAVFTAIALVPPLWIAAAAGVSSQPRLSIWWDMDYQPKFKAQTTSNVFADGRAMRPPVAGTVARGSLRDDMRLFYGIEPEGADQTASTTRPIRFASFLQEDADGEGAEDSNAGGEGQAGEEEDPNEPNWTTEFPMSVTDEVMARGRQRFDIYCAACHGLAGDGDGLVTRRAMALQQGTWSQPTSVHTDYVKKQPVGKLYNTITNGIRKMPGYSHQIAVEDRWAVVAYLRALQKSQDAEIEEVPENMQDKLR